MTLPVDFWVRPCADFLKNCLGAYFPYIWQICYIWIHMKNMRTVAMLATAIGMAAAGAVRSMVRKVSYVRGLGGRGCPATDLGKDKRYRPYYFSIRTKRYSTEEVYFSFAQIWLPRVINRVYLYELVYELSYRYCDRIGGYCMSICESLPNYSCTYNYRESVHPYYTRAIKPMFRFREFSRRHGIRLSRILDTMKDFSGQLYARLVEDGVMREEDVR